jgi:plastocyanin
VEERHAERTAKGRGERPGVTTTVAYALVLLLLASMTFLYVGLDKGSPPAGAGSVARSTDAYRVAQVASASDYTLVVIPQGARVPPAQFNVTELLTNKYPYPVNFTVALGVNNTIEWLNNDTVDHTVSSFVTPSGAQTWSSGLIPPGGTFTQVLTVPGVYKYTCIWHPWLSGEIRVVEKA